MICTTCGCGNSDGRGIAFDGASAGRTCFCCKGRSVCPSCNARHMAETAAHLTNHVFPPLPVRQCVLSVPKRLRYFLQHDPEAISAVLHILLRVIEARLRQGSGCAHGRLGAVSFCSRISAAR